MWEKSMSGRRWGIKNTKELLKISEDGNLVNDHIVG
jgi:hypothetical protein